MSPILLLIPTASFVLLILGTLRGTTVYDLCLSVLRSTLIITTFVLLVTELLSAATAIMPSALTASWSIFMIACGVLAYSNRRRIRPLFSVRLDFTLVEGILVVTVLCGLLMILVNGLVYPPNNWDSMTYHMARVAHWQANQSIDYYNTAIHRQNYQMPLAEWGILHVMSLSGSDRWANAVQWLAFLVSIVATVGLASAFGLGRRQTLVTAVVAATIPMAILQASSTQNDVVVSAFVLMFVLFMVRLRRGIHVDDILFAALALGLALAAKGTAYLFIAGTGLCLAVPILAIKPFDLPRVARRIAVLGAIVAGGLLMNSGIYHRNLVAYQSPLSSGGDTYTNRSLSAKSIASLIVRNLALHTGTRLKDVNTWQANVLTSVFGDELNNPDTTYPGTTFQIVFVRHEDGAGNPVHLLLFFISLAALSVRWRRGEDRHILPYALSVIVSFLIFSIVLQWQPWGSRLQTPLFFLIAPLVGLVLGQSRRGNRMWNSLQAGTLGLLLVCSSQIIWYNASRPFDVFVWLQRPRVDRYFVNRPFIREDYLTVADIIAYSGSRDVGLIIGKDDWEYPLWVIVNRDRPPGETAVLRHLAVKTPVSPKPDSTSPPWIIASVPIDGYEHAADYVVFQKTDALTLYIRAAVK